MIIIYIIKLEFFYIFKTAYDKIMIFENIKSNFRGTSLIPFNPTIVISKFDIKLQISIPTRPPPTNTDL